MRKIASLARALALSAALFALPQAAQADTGPGTSSSGNFEMVLRVDPPPDSVVTIIGLDDMHLGTVQREPGVTIQNELFGQDNFCINYAGFHTGAHEQGIIGHNGFPGLINVQIFQVGGGVNGEFALKGDLAGDKYLPVAITFVGGRIGFESRPGGYYLRTDGSAFQVAPTPDSCDATSTELTFNAARVSVVADPIPADSAQADGELSAIFSVIISP